MKTDLEIMEYYKAIFNHMDEFIGLLDPKGILLEANPSSLNFIGCTMEDVKGQLFWETPWWSSTPNEQEKLKQAVFKAARGESSHFITKHVNPDGTPLIIDFTLSPIYDDNGTLKWLVPEGRNITELRQARKAFEISEKKYKTLFEQSSDPILILQNEHIQECNEAAALLLGLSTTQDLIGSQLTDLTPLQQPGGQASSDYCHAFMESAYVRGRGRGEMYLKNSEGIIVPVELSITAIPDPVHRVLHVILRDITEQKQQEAEIRSLNEELRRKVKATANELEQATDILESSIEQLAHSEKLAALGSLMPGFSHELNTPMGVSVTTASFIHDSVSRIDRKMRAGELTKTDFDRFVADTLEASKAMLTNLDRAARMVFSIKNISTDQVSDIKRLFNFREYLEDLILSLHSETKKYNCQIRIDCPEALNIRSVPGIYSQIFTNLIINSLQHGLIGDYTCEVDINVDIKGTHLMVEYKDNGQGMDEETRRQAFDPFYTTKREDGNTGLVMHIIHDLVTEALEGSIQLDSRIGEGIRIYMEIPLEE